MKKTQSADNRNTKNGLPELLTCRPSVRLMHLWKDILSPSKLFCSMGTVLGFQSWYSDCNGNFSCLCVHQEQAGRTLYLLLCPILEGLKGVV
jgi:hypothetical protein